MKKYLKWTIFVVLLLVVIILGLGYPKETSIEKEEIKGIEKNTYIKDGSLYKKNKLDIIYKENVTEEQRVAIESKYGLKRLDPTDEIVFQYKTIENVKYKEFKKLLNSIEKESLIETAAGVWDLPRTTNKDWDN